MYRYGSNADIKVRFLKMLFPEGVVYDSVNHRFGTSQISPLYRVLPNKKDLPEKEKSFLVAEPGHRLRLFRSNEKENTSCFLFLISLHRTCFCFAKNPGLWLGQNQEKSPTFVGLFSWLRDQDSNLGPHGYEPCELPLLHPAMLASVI